jgi:hypothetical protein
MDEIKTETTEEASQPQQEKQDNRVLRIILRVLTSIFTLLLIAFAVFLVVHRDTLNLDSLKRYLTYRALERSDNGMGVTFPIGQEEELCSVSLSDSVILCSENRIQLYSDGGTQYEDISAAMSQPVINASGNYAVVYDAGGNDLYLFADRQMIYHYATQSDYGLISAHVNSHGWLCVVEQASGYKGTVTVYNPSQEPVVTERISSQFVMDAVISPDNRQLAVLTIGQNETDFSSVITIYQVENGEQVSTQEVSNAPVLDLQWDNEGLWLQQQYGIRRLDRNFAQVSNWENNALYLQGYTLGGDGFAVEYFSRDRSGSLGQVVVIDHTGDVLGTMNVSRELLSITAAGRYIALLTSEKLTIYTSDFTEYATLPNTTGIQAALMRADGTAMLIQGETATVFLP